MLMDMPTSGAGQHLLYAHVLKKVPFFRVRKASAKAWVRGRPVLRVPNTAWGVWGGGGLSSDDVVFC